MLATTALAKTYFPPRGVRKLLMRAPVREPVVAVDGVTFEVRAGEVFGLLGPNGAGKTTLIKMLTTLLHPTSGSATINGFDLVRDEDDVRRSVGLVTGEERSFYYRLSGRQNLAFFASLAGLHGAVASRRVAEVLRVMGLEGKADDMYYSYSTGMRQKLGIARAMLSDPRLLFLDEPTRGVDVVTVSELKGLIRGPLLSEGRSVVLATHRMEEAEQLCDRIAIMLEGRVVFCGTVPELRTRAGAREVCAITVGGLRAERCTELCTRRELADATVQPLQPDESVRVEFSINGRRSALSEVLGDLIRSGGVVLTCERRERSLEELFIDVVRGGGE